MNEFTNSVVSGLVTAIVWAMLIWLINLGRNLIVTHSLHKNMSRIGVSYGNDGFGVSLKNETKIPILIRDVTLLTNKSEEGIALPYVEPTHEFMLTEKRTRQFQSFKFRTIGSPDMKKETTAHGFVELPPYTGGIWKIEPRFFLNNMDIRPISARATVEYKTFLGNPKLIIVRSDEGSSQLIKDMFADFLKYIAR
ncbi:MAG: hypothetical protein PHR77_12310 [Kiritimatiellae bacterium]|nr:hypothetical protein [Kiritimatiellia bacterium]MDD5522614.1 hypothetical protein [Kiritimatiellia bacterium]